MTKKFLYYFIIFILFSILIVACKPTTKEEKTAEKIMNCDDKNENTKDYFDEQKKECIHDKIKKTDVLAPSVAYCGSKKTEGPRISESWERKDNCTANVIKDDGIYANVSTDYYSDIIPSRRLGKERGVGVGEFYFELPSHINEQNIISIKVILHMICRSYFTPSTQTKFGEWKNIYSTDPNSNTFNCPYEYKDERKAEIVPEVHDRKFAVRISKMELTAEAYVDLVVAEVEYYLG